MKKGSPGPKKTPDKAPKTHPSRPLGAKHKLLLILMGIVGACVLVVVVELVLRIAGYGPDLTIFKKTKVLGEDYVEFNREVSLRYFPPEMARRPGFERFPAEKAPGTYRIFSLGASSTVGDPFGPNSSFTAFLGEMLQDVHPEAHFEVINCGIVALSSISLLELHDAVLEHEPDAILIYTGHNEVYGVDAVLSGLRSELSTRGLLKLRAQLRNTRIGRLAQDLARKMRGSKSGDETKGFGMDLMEGKVLPSWDPLHEKMLDIYRANLTEMIDRARKRGVDVILCTLVSNLRDQSPMGSAHGPHVTEERRSAWEEAFETGRRAMTGSRWDEAARALTQAAAIDSFHAETRFRLARCLDAKAVADSVTSRGLLEAARTEYRAARDQDIVHFRACTQQNRVVREVAGAADSGVLLVDLERELTRVSPHGIPGREFMTEHVHPYIRGHAFLAGGICRAMADSPVGAKLGSWDLSRIRSAEEYMERRMLSDVDRASGLFMTLRFKLGKWPFTQAYENEVAATHLRGEIRELSKNLNPFEAQVFSDYTSGRFANGYDYGYRHQRIAQAAMGQRKFRLSIQEYRKCESLWGLNATTVTNLAQAHLAGGMHARADSLLDLATELDPELAQIHFVRGMLRQSQGRLMEARAQLHEYLARESTGIFADAARQMLGRMGARP